MENKSRVEELLSEMLLKQDNMVEQLVKLNLQTAENSRAIFKLADKIEQVVDHEKRISKLELKVFK